MIRYMVTHTPHIYLGTYLVIVYQNYILYNNYYDKKKKTKKNEKSSGMKKKRM